jgi:hypothetical protein
MCSSGGSIQLPGVATRRSGAISIVASSSFATRAINRAWRPRRCRTSASPARPTSRADSRPGERPGFPSSGPGTLIEIAEGNPPRHHRPGSSAHPTDDFDHQDRLPWLADPTRPGAGWNREGTAARPADQAAAPPLLDTVVSGDACDTTAADDEEERRGRLLLLGKGAVLARRFDRPLAAESDEQRQSRRREPSCRVQAKATARLPWLRSRVDGV